ncbi:MAG: mechanosensitive ion channel family protein [Candidatus Gastranaerophilales bacterium]|nr:mechanosensitive ion channel family protein [Candidatus Gastranaerophilales bacterium]
MAENLISFLILILITITSDIVFRRIIAEFLKKQAEKNSLPCLFANSTLLPISKLIYATGLYFALTSLELTESTQASIESIYTIALFVIISWLAFKSIGCLGAFLSMQMQKKESSSAVYFAPIITRTLNFFTATILIVILLQKLGYNVSSLVAGLGITGLAVGFAAKETLADIFGSFTVILDNVFKIGDVIAIEEKILDESIIGVVEDISLLSTKIRALDNSIVTISNHRIAGMTVKNLSRRTKFRICESIGITYDSDTKKLERAVELCRNVAQNHPQIEEGFSVYFNQFGDCSLKIIFIAYAKCSDYTEYLEIREELFLEIKKAFDTENIEFAFPTQTLYLKN